ncbi:MAG TPA: GNAT family N-acetyltransferase [Acidimicrobiales bacterium]|nr:GNAT family N-acetyltransferase [Acidimicrobiales bacterium]
MEALQPALTLPWTRLVRPDPALQRSFLEAMAEFAAAGRGGPADDSMIGYELRSYGPTWGSAAGFGEYLGRLRADAEGVSLRPGRVGSTTFWWAEGGTYIGRIAVRHELNDWLLEVGGNIGYDVRPSARRRGHATAMLRAVLPEAQRLGVDPALVTCDVDNVASRKVIEHAGGVLEDERRGKLRYWVRTGD